MNHKFDLEERLINYSVLIIDITDNMLVKYSATHLAKQLLRSGTATALNYGEAQSGESRKDFIHKMKIVLKELRESNICLKIMLSAKLIKSDNKVIQALSETNELISIFVKSIATAEQNNLK